MVSKAAQARAAERARADIGPHLSVEVNGAKYLLAARDMTGLDVRELRRQTGYSYNGLVAAFTADYDVDLVAAVVWMARRQQGDTEVTYDEVALGMNPAMDWKFVPAEVSDSVTVGGGETPET